MWTSSSVLIIVITLLVMAKTRRSAEFVFTHYDASASGWPSGWSFFVGLLQAAYTLTGYGMVAALCEEVQNPHKEVPRAMVLSVVAAGVTGIVYLIPILFVLPDVATLLGVANGQPIGLLFKTVTGSAGGGFGLLFLSKPIASISSTFANRQSSVSYSSLVLALSQQLVVAHMRSSATSPDLDRKSCRLIFSYKS